MTDAARVRGIRADWLTGLVCASVGIQVGASLVAVRYIANDIGPASLAMLRYAVGVLCLLPFLLRRGCRIPIPGHDLLVIAMLGIVQFGGVVALLNFGLQYISAGRAGLIFATFPLQTLLLAALLGHERLTAPKSAGVTLTIVGVGFALGETSLAGGGHPRAWLGELAVLASAFCGALCSVLYRPYLRRYPPLPVSTIAMAASVAFLALMAIGERYFDAAPRLTWGGWGAVAFIGVSSGIFYYLWLWALERTSATRVTVFLSLSPLTAAALGAALLGEPVTWPLAVGLACVIAGLWLAYRPEAAAGSGAPQGRR